ncbi:MAG: nucleotidyltransferase family protein [Candidatus Altiarchaeota archaeon]|nr:nucleotidyltransferase family protein [Candidatus Altiarchaeota archaeon]
MKLVIVAGGLATRMRPITEEIPKCLIDVNGKPLIEHQLEFFREHGFKDIVFCVAHLADKVKKHFGVGRDFGLCIEYVQETGALLGTAGSVKLAENLLDDDFIVHYGDNLTSMDFHKLIAYHKDKKSEATVVVRPLPPGYKSSSLVVLDEKNRIKAFKEKPTMDEMEKYSCEKKYINSGIYVLGREVLDRIPENTKYDFTKDLFPKLLEEDFGFFGYPTEEYFREIGRVEKYEAFLKEVKGKKEIL